MADIKDGGSAFPVERLHTEQRDGRWMDRWIPEGGMSLRDYFAGQALMRCQPDDSEDTPKEKAMLAAWAYAVADAMLAAREAK